MCCFAKSNFHLKLPIFQKNLNLKPLRAMLIACDIEYVMCFLTLV